MFGATYSACHEGHDIRVEHAGVHSGLHEGEEDCVNTVAIAGKRPPTRTTRRARPARTSDARLRRSGAIASDTATSG
jgi:hypothetical protein